MKLCNIGHSFDYETEKLCRLFFPFEKIEILHEASNDEFAAVTSLNCDSVSAIFRMGGNSGQKTEVLPAGADEQKKEMLLAGVLFRALVDVTGYQPKWGMLTGIRPAKLYSHLCEKTGEEQATASFRDDYFVSEEKIRLCKETRVGEEAITVKSRPESFSFYLSVPFCPTRCSYCSFVSHAVKQAGKLMDAYVEKLCEEIRVTAQIANRLGLRLETVYMGGGTPTTLSTTQLKKILTLVRESFDFSTVREFTVEAGRPDTITAEKLSALSSCGVERISINPQTMNDSVLNAIGRRHTVKQTVDAFRIAREAGFQNINMDLIAGLPTDTFESFRHTVEAVLALSPESVTVHSLSMKRASDLTADGCYPGRVAGEEADKMVSFAREKLTENGVRPYYMYRQSKTVGNLENVGYAVPGTECLYNVYIMDETHTILACGASAVTKLREPCGPFIDRIFNYKYPFEYIDRFDEMIRRKEKIVQFYDQYPVRDK